MTLHTDLQSADVAPNGVDDNFVEDYVGVCVWLCGAGGKSA